MRKNREPYLSVEPPDTSATVDFLGPHGFALTVEVGKSRTGEPEVWVKVTACDDRSTILGEIVAIVPESDRRS
jgi:hypothetical protein